MFSDFCISSGPAMFNDKFQQLFLLAIQKAQQLFYAVLSPTQNARGFNMNRRSAQFLCFLKINNVWPKLADQLVAISSDFLVGSFHGESRPVCQATNSFM